MPSLSRLFICLLLGVLLTTPAIAAPVRVGVILSSDNIFYQDTYKALADSLEKSGYTADKVKIYIQRPNADLFSWANSVRRAESIGMDALVTIGSPVTRVAIREATGIPIVFAGVTSPIDTPLEQIQPSSKGASHPITGIYAQTPVATLIKTFNSVQPSGSITALFHENDPEFAYQSALIQDACELYGYNCTAEKLSSKKFSTELKRICEASKTVLVVPGPFSKLQLQSISKEINKGPTTMLGYGYGLAQMGSLISIETAAKEQGDQAARQLARILQGAKVKDISIIKPRSTDLIVNLSVAQKLGIKVPFNALTAASKVIR